MTRTRAVTIVTYNVFGGGKFSKLRRSAIVDNILGGTETKSFRPDVICLQEATEDIISALQDALDGNYYVFTKLESLRDAGTEGDQLDAVRKEGFLAILSRYPFLSQSVVHEGGWLDDGILKCSVLLATPQEQVRSVSESPPIPLTVYNYHGSGGTFGKPMHVILKKRAQRVEELKVLTEDMKTELGRNDFPDGASPMVVIAGDFNSDCNDPEAFPESAGFPEKVLDGKTLSVGQGCKSAAKIRCYDVWMSVRKSPVGSQTESHKYNSFRAWLKPMQKREATFDRVVVAYCRARNNEESMAVDPVSIDLIGNSKIETLALDKNGNVVDEEAASVNNVDVFPSDHFGLVSRLSVFKIR